MKPKAHWENVYNTKATTDLSWFQAHGGRSLQLIRDAAVPGSAPIIDVGGGASTLVDDLLTEGYEHVTALDLSGSALEKTKTRLGERAAQIRWLEANVLEAELPAHSYAVWHDRAVFHFLTAQTDRQAYVRQVLQAVKPGGHVIVATFAEDGPSQCSGLPVMRYSARELSDQMAAPFQLLDHQKKPITRRAVMNRSSSIVYFVWQGCSAAPGFATSLGLPSHGTYKRFVTGHD